MSMTSELSASISIHAPPRGATEEVGQIVGVDKFQFTPLREGRRAPKEPSAPRTYFNSRPSARGDDGHPAGFRRPVYFNSRPSARGDGGLRVRLHRWRRFQFTPLREGRRKSTGSGRARFPFQFTPLREGRLRLAFIIVGYFYFNSRPSARGDGRKKRYKVAVYPFQFTPLREGRRETAEMPRTIKISIHAPPRGATHQGSPRMVSPVDFNSRPSARGDGLPPRWSRWACYFNSRPSARGDCRFACCFLAFCISIHAPPRGATRWGNGGQYLHTSISIHAPPRGATNRSC